ncbi:MAG: glycerol kinase GlpK [Deltaproteobacteria bacterium]|nr:glycerol kinase GlpK [Deltaproteobacteria bacterium]
MPDVILSIDQGTTGTTIVLIDGKLNVLSRGYREFRQIYPKPGWVEHDPEDIWTSLITALDDALANGSVSAGDIRAIGITNQRETDLVWNGETGESYHNAVVWQCRRTAELCRDMKDRGLEEMFTERTGLVLDPYFSGTKLKWQFDHVSGLRDEAAAGRVRAGTVDSYLIWRLTNGKSHVTDASNASRTLLMDLKTLQWDEELCSVLDIPRQVLPEIRGCTDILGYTEQVPGLPDGIPICGSAGDQQAALFGQACFQPGEAKCTYGTGAFLLMNTGETPVPSRNRLLTTVAWKLGDSVTYALEGSAFIAGAVVQWLRDELRIIENAPQVEELALTVPDSGGVVLVPAFVGLGAPHWRSDARGIITGLTRGTSRAHIARAALEGIALQNAEILKAMESDSGRSLLALKVDGGASANDLLMQMQADFLGCRIVRPRMVETTALGAAFLAALGAGIMSDTADIVRNWKEDRTFAPRWSDEERQSALERWREAVGKA